MLSDSAALMAHIIVKSESARVRTLMGAQWVLDPSRKQRSDRKDKAEVHHAPTEHLQIVAAQHSVNHQKVSRTQM